MKQIKINCDYCGIDLSVKTGVPGFRLMLSSEKVPHRGIVKTARVTPDIDRTHHFCDLPCLAGWLRDDMELVT